jgi:hypothetical protein
MTTTTATKSWVPVVASIQVTLGLAGLVALLASPVAALVVAGVATVIALGCRALVRASHRLDRILDEELGR